MVQELRLGDVDIRCRPFSHYRPLIAIFVDGPCRRNAALIHDRGLAPPHCQLCSCRSSGGIVAGVLSNPQHALWTVIVSYALWGIGLPLAMMVMVIYLQRLNLHRIPPKAVIVTVFLPPGPLSQGSFGSTHHFPSGAHTSAIIWRRLLTVGFLVALILWAFALVWLFFALASIVRCKSFPFNIGWWGFTFPLGVFVQL
ncbi:voltage-dependent anion channel-domain-containing protein [Aspergillus arachidicola]|uniref:Voltage-dependent anion channel-domain-containing protein n=1 Tax=Aspergillus arachidicola TaxID=656916 RepID=A0A5N6YMU9_9EURO|nr:voltage-dependent anion channel-domain-containing protein [Aspergillus arachidicola]